VRGELWIFSLVLLLELLHPTFLQFVVISLGPGNAVIPVPLGLLLRAGISLPQILKLLHLVAISLCLIGVVIPLYVGLLSNAENSLLRILIYLLHLKVKERILK
jgi:hypothetical protein